MEPTKESTPNQYAQGGLERLNPESQGFEQLPSRRSLEQLPSSSETKEIQTGAGKGDNFQQQGLPTPVMPTPAPPKVQDDQSATTASTKKEDNPLIADDVDVIEKEWVDRTKKILQDTKDDPHQKEYEISHLQADYLKKRFGVEVKLPQG